MAAEVLLNCRWCLRWCWRIRQREVTRTPSLPWVWPVHSWIWTTKPQASTKFVDHPQHSSPHSFMCPSLFLWSLAMYHLFSLFSHYFHHISPPSILLLIPFIFLKANIFWNFAGFRKWVPSRGRAQSWLLSQVKGLVHLFVWGWPSTPSDRPALLPWWLCVSSWVHRWYVPARFYSHLGKSGFVRVRQNYYICSCKMFICKTVSLFRKFYSKLVWLKVFWTPSAWMCCWCLSRRRRIQIFSHLDSISMVKSIGHWMRT